MEAETKVTANYDRDSRRFHRYLITEGQAVKGTLYIPKDSDGVPEKIVVELREDR